MADKIKNNSSRKKNKKIIYNNKVNLTLPTVQEPALPLFQEKIKIGDKNSLIYLHKDLHNLLRLFIENSKRSSNTKIFLKTNNINDENKFIVESAIL